MTTDSRIKEASLYRYEGSDQGTFSLMVSVGFRCHVVELPWRENRRNISCVPVGRYLCKIRRSPRFGRVYELQDVEGRSYVLTHSGNVAGDRTKGWKTHSAGCLLLGRYRGKIGNQKAVMCSRPTLRKFMQTMGDDPFWLNIQEV